MDAFRSIFFSGLLAPLIVRSTPQLLCPSPFGAFPDVTDCSGYIQCVNSAPFRRRCPAGTSFDLTQRRCRPSVTVSCGARGSIAQPTPILIQPRVQTQPPVPRSTPVLGTRGTGLDTRHGAILPGGVTGQLPGTGGVILGPFASNPLQGGLPGLGTIPGQYPVGGGFQGAVIGPPQTSPDLLSILGGGGLGTYPLGPYPGSGGIRPSYTQPSAVISIQPTAGLEGQDGKLDTAQCTVIENTMNQVLIELIRNMCGIRCDPSLIPSLKVTCLSQ